MDGSHFYLTHNNWRPLSGAWVLDDAVRATAALGDEQKLISILAEKESGTGAWAGGKPLQIPAALDSVPDFL